ncbi:hypothetical protein CSV79_01545 [Sporosarcina sp. P13]|uniref:bacteriophage Gp15 family protein n=1 Tax=Sporosarcina sp. P13 TaxID=2048263 RepID=UPI000C163C62|nr:bacteriophage Gp15 family protein [Sporosarcina sp. P13]PIC65333.1 hypothetical protein CSV79_01545 [Sporosarcina sp. P13]
MFTLAYPLTETVEIDGTTYPIDMSFDNILRLIEMLNDQEIDDVTQVELGMQMFIGVDLDCDINLKGSIFNKLFEDVVSEGEKKSRPVDIKGNPMPSNEESEGGASYSLTEDAEYIYASFMQDYGMDLFEYQGKLHWSKFRALLAGLGDETKFKKVLEIRGMELPTGKGTEKQRKSILDAKRAYALKGQPLPEAE